MNLKLFSSGYNCRHAQQTCVNDLWFSMNSNLSFFLSCLRCLLQFDWPRIKGTEVGIVSNRSLEPSKGLMYWVMVVIVSVVVKAAQSCPTLCDLTTIQSMGFSRPECWSGWPFPSPGGIPNPGIEPRSPTLQVDSLPAETPGKPLLMVDEQYLLLLNVHVI